VSSTFKGESRKIEKKDCVNLSRDICCLCKEINDKYIDNPEAGADILLSALRFNLAMVLANLTEEYYEKTLKALVKDLREDVDFIKDLAGEEGDNS
jgi:hypothetical protein